MDARSLSEAAAGEAAAILARVMPSIVCIEGRRRGGASGVAWPGTAGVLTNYHVVAGTDGALRIVGADGHVRAARVAAVHRGFDLALVGVPEADLATAPVGDSGRLRVGELVFAVGHPWGERWAVTAGIVSGLAPIRLPGSRHPVPGIRSDVRLAPGNSGGPLLNARGEVVGLNAMVLGGDLSVAIPSDTVRDWLAQAAAIGRGR